MKIIIVPFFVLLLNPALCKYFADEVNSVLYDLSISAFPLNEEAKDQNHQNTGSDSAGAETFPTDVLTIGNKHGQKYQCQFPTYTERPQGNDEGLLDPPAASRVTTEEIREVLDPVLKGLCFKNTKDRGGWWTYEFCYKDAIMQYHLESDNKRTGETIYLGRFESEKDWTTPEAVAELTGKRKKTLYHSHYYTNGTVCDLTNNFRRAEVRFMCYEELPSGAFLQSVDEPESCDYGLTIYTAALCRLPAFLPADRKPPPLKIECQPVLTAPEYEKYLKAKEAEEAKKAEEAARKKAEQELKLKIEAEKKKYHKPESLKTPPAAPAVASTSDKAQEKVAEKPILDILGRLKTDFMKPILKREAAIAAGKSVEEADKETREMESGERLLGAVGTIEYEYMTHWLEQQLEELEMEESVTETDEQIAAEKDLSELEKYAVNEFKRKTRRMSIWVAFRAQLEEIVEDVYFSITQYDSRVKGLRGERLKLAEKELEVALTAALTNLITEMDETEREMEMLDEKTGLSGLAAFQRMREMIQARQRIVQELEDSNMDVAEFVKAKLAAMPPISEEELARFDAEADESSSTTATSVKKEPGHAEPPKTSEPASSKAKDPTGVLKGEKQSDVWLNKDEKGKSGITKSKHVGEASQGQEGSPGSESGKESNEDGAKADSSKRSNKKLREEMETQLGNIMGDVERELKDEGVFDDLNEQEVAEVKTEAFRSLARTLTSLLEKLDEAERDVDLANEQLEEATKAINPSKATPSASKRSKEKDTEKKLNIWRKLLQGLDDEQEQAESNESHQRKPLGKIQVKRGDAAKSKTGSADGVHVRVSTIKRKEADESDGDETAAGSETSKLERRIAEKLKDAGFDTQGRPVQVKIITNFDLDESDNLVHALSDEESEQFTNVIYAILGGGGVEHTAEQRRQQSLESSYNFGGETEGDEGKEKRPSPMKTVVVGGRP